MANDKISFVTTEQLGPHQALTPDGFLLCRDVPLARTGVHQYATGEVPVDAGPDGLITVIRDSADVFAPQAIASFQGKPVTNDHPPMKVGPDNWKKYAIGVVLNPRQGDGIQFDNDFLFADLLIHDEDAIKDVREGKREVSAGYDADYEQLAPGQGRQHLIMGNHVALVDKGRCGPRCAIGDEDMAGSTRNPAWHDRIMQAHKTGDAGALVMELEKIGDMLGNVLMGDEKTVETEDKGVHVHLHSKDDSKGRAKDDEGEGGGGGSEIMQRLEALERAVAILAQGEEGEDKKSKDSKAKRTKDADEDKDDEDEDDKDDKSESKDSKAKRTKDKKAKVRDEDKEDDEDQGDKDTKDADEDKEDDDDKDDKSESKDRASVGDSSSLQVTWQELITRAEMLVPGIKMPTFDSKRSAKLTVDAMCQFRRKALTDAMKEDDTKGVIEQLGGQKPALAQMTCDAVSVLFNGASELVRQMNTRRTTQTTMEQRYTQGNTALSDTVKMINQRNREKYGVTA